MAHCTKCGKPCGTLYTDGFNPIAPKYLCHGCYSQMQGGRLGCLIILAKWFVGLLVGLGLTQVAMRCATHLIPKGTDKAEEFKILVGVEIAVAIAFVASKIGSCIIKNRFLCALCRLASWALFWTAIVFGGFLYVAYKLG